MKNQPVAWRTHYPSGWEYKDGNPPFELKGNSQLLYTHPAKELTEDEIKEVADSVCHDWDEDGLGHLYMVDFARAILRKASEK